MKMPHPPTLQTYFLHRKTSAAVLTDSWGKKRAFLNFIFFSVVVWCRVMIVKCYGEDEAVWHSVSTDILRWTVSFFSDVWCPLVTAREWSRDQGRDKEDDKHPNRDRHKHRRTHREAGRQTDRQTDREGQTDRRRESVVELDSESRTGEEAAGSGSHRTG